MAESNESLGPIPGGPVDNLVDGVVLRVLNILGVDQTVARPKIQRAIKILGAAEAAIDTFVAAMQKPDDPTN